MRIPVRRVYRAFAELDRLSDEQCEKLLAYIQQTTNYGIMVVLKIVLTIGSALVILVSAFSYLVPDLTLSAEMAVVLIVAAPLLLSLVTRDAVLRHYFKLGLEKRLGQLRCPTCRYLLLGQRVECDVVRCPECGTTTKLQTLGLESAADLLPPNAVDHKTPPPG